jgi:nitrogen fixation/metabolism regulation signal transduction histidine kinase
MKFHRKKFVTHKKLQYGFVLALGILGGILGLMNSWIQAYLSESDPQRTHLTALLTVAGVLVLVCGPIVLAALVFTNRVAGPLKRFQGHMEAAAKGDIQLNFKFRDKDLFKDLETPYNQILEKLKTLDKK